MSLFYSIWNSENQILLLETQMSQIFQLWDHMVSPNLSSHDLVNTEVRCHLYYDITYTILSKILTFFMFVLQILEVGEEIIIIISLGYPIPHVQELQHPQLSSIFVNWKLWILKKKSWIRRLNSLVIPSNYYVILFLVPLWIFFLIFFKQNVFMKHYAPTGKKSLNKLFSPKSRSQGPWPWCNLKGHRERSMHSKYKVSISYSSKFIA